MVYRVPRREDHSDHRGADLKSRGSGGDLGGALALACSFAVSRRCFRAASAAPSFASRSSACDLSHPDPHRAVWASALISDLLAASFDASSRLMSCSERSAALRAASAALILPSASRCLASAAAALAWATARDSDSVVTCIGTAAELIP